MKFETFIKVSLIQLLNSNHNNSLKGTLSYNKELRQREYLEIILLCEVKCSSKF